MIASNVHPFGFMVRSICLPQWFQHIDDEHIKPFDVAENVRPWIFAYTLPSYGVPLMGFSHHNHIKLIAIESLFHIVAPISTQFFHETLAHVFERADMLFLFDWKLMYFFRSIWEFFWWLFISYL